MHLQRESLGVQVKLESNDTGLQDPLFIAGRHFQSRLIGGTGKFSSHSVMADAHAAARCEMVTVAMRRVDLALPADDITRFIDPSVLLLPNTAGAVNADEAVRFSMLARAAGITDEQGRTWIKLEVIDDQRYLLPDPIETLRAAELLIAEDFVVLPYISPDPPLARRLEDVGCATVMPLGSFIGSNKGVRARDAIGIIIESAGVPVVVDAGLGAPSHAAECMEMGASSVLVNTAIATSRDPRAMAEAFKQAVEAGRTAFLAGLPLERDAAAASSPLPDLLVD